MRNRKLTHLTPEELIALIKDGDIDLSDKDTVWVSKDKRHDMIVGQAFDDNNYIINANIIIPNGKFVFAGNLVCKSILAEEIILPYNDKENKPFAYSLESKYVYADDIRMGVTGTISADIIKTEVISAGNIKSTILTAKDVYCTDCTADTMSLSGNFYAKSIACPNININTKIYTRGRINCKQYVESLYDLSPKGLEKTINNKITDLSCNELNEIIIKESEDLLPFLVTFFKTSVINMELNRGYVVKIDPGFPHPVKNDLCFDVSTYWEFKDINQVVEYAKSIETYLTDNNQQWNTYTSWQSILKKRGKAQAIDELETKIKNIINDNDIKSPETLEKLPKWIVDIFTRILATSEREREVIIANIYYKIRDNDVVKLPNSKLSKNKIFDSVTSSFFSGENNDDIHWNNCSKEYLSAFIGCLVYQSQTGRPIIRGDIGAAKDVQRLTFTSEEIITFIEKIFG